MPIRWSPARARAAGGGRTDLDAGEHRPQFPAQEQAGQPLDNKEVSIGADLRAYDVRTCEYFLAFDEPAITGSMPHSGLLVMAGRGVRL